MADEEPFFQVKVKDFNTGNDIRRLVEKIVIARIL
jgi:hypothetical protein